MAAMADTARDLVSSMTLPDDREAAAEILGREIRKRHDRASQRGALNAARKALGLPSIERTFTDATNEIDAKGRSRARAVSKGGKKARKAAKKRGVRSLGTTGTASAGGIIAQALGLVVLYFVLRNASTGADALAGIRRGVEWIMKPIPIGGTNQ